MNGLLIQWGEYITNGDNIITTSFPVKFSTNVEILVSGYPNNTTITSEVSTDNILIIKNLYHLLMQNGIITIQIGVLSG